MKDETCSVCYEPWERMFIFSRVEGWPEKDRGAFFNGKGCPVCRPHLFWPYPTEPPKDD